MSFGTRERDLLSGKEKLVLVRKMRSRFQECVELICGCHVNYHCLLKQKLNGKGGVYRRIDFAVGEKRVQPRAVEVYHVMRSRIEIPSTYEVLHHDFCCCKGCENPEHSKMGSRSENNTGKRNVSFEETNQKRGELIAELLKGEVSVSNLAELKRTSVSAIEKFMEIWGIQGEEF